MSLSGQKHTLQLAYSRSLSHSSERHKSSDNAFVSQHTAEIVAKAFSVHDTVHTLRVCCWWKEWKIWGAFQQDKANLFENMCFQSLVIHANQFCENQGAIQYTTHFSRCWMDLLGNCSLSSKLMQSWKSIFHRHRKCRVKHGWYCCAKVVSIFQNVQFTIACVWTTHIVELWWW